jgi:hypothetical protein
LGGMPIGLEQDFKSKKCLEKEIAQMVYELHGLTSDEIAIFHSKSD